MSDAVIRLALDRSSRHYDKDGRLHVLLAPISKAQVSPYYGHEIPGGEILGLQRDKIYYMLRAAEELERGAATFCNVPLMATHYVQTPEDPNKDMIAGSTGTDCIFEFPYLRVSLVIWTAEDIALVETKQRCQISCGYAYDPDMTPGEYEGLHYDGIMRNIVCNHVALVEEGRAGPDVLVSDSGRIRGSEMASKLALMVRGAVGAFLAPRLAQDAQINMGSLVEGVTRDNFKTTMRPAVVGRITAATRGRLAADATLDGLDAIMDAMEKEDCDGEDEMADDADPDDKTEDEDPDDKTEDESEEEKARKEAEARDKRAKDKRAKDKRAKDDPPEFEGKPKVGGGMDRKAMDRAIQTGVAAGIASSRALDAALIAVKPAVGVLQGMPSAEAVYKYALDKAAIDTTGVHPSAYRALFELSQKRQEGANDDLSTGGARDSALAEDDGFFTQFPDAKRLAGR